MNAREAQEHLEPDPASADALVDLSGVVCDDRFGGPHPRSLDRLGPVVEALVRRTGDRRVRVHAVARPDLGGPAGGYPSAEHPRLLADWVGRGLVAEFPDAGGALLELAELTGLPVVSDDGFEEHRELFPWIQGDTGRFLGVRRRSGGGVSVRRRDMGVHAPGARPPRAGEPGPGAPRPLPDGERLPLVRALQRSWRCPRRRCALYGRDRGAPDRVPELRGGRPVCEEHGADLVDEGPRASLVELKLLVDGECVHRFTLDREGAVVVGRAPGEGGIPLHPHLPPDVAARVSRAHLEVTVRDGEALVRNLSAKGTYLRVRGSVDLRRLGGSRPRVLVVNDVVELVSAVALTRGARRYPPEPVRAWQAAARQARGTGAGEAPADGGG
ncbi:FHA domain-containing protein [Nocardiopsis flavescens]|uniref:FHA domain-containing protein n=1 Tax=Nocardiopsis flavescens TaxID=758803 RepID=UPI0036676B17